jgi:hypothetical protein
MDVITGTRNYSGLEARIPEKREKTRKMPPQVRNQSQQHAILQHLATVSRQFHISYYALISLIIT